MMHLMGKKETRAIPSHLNPIEGIGLIRTAELPRVIHII